MTHSYEQKLNSITCEVSLPYLKHSLSHFNRKENNMN